MVIIRYLHLLQQVTITGLSAGILLAGKLSFQTKATETRVVDKIDAWRGKLCEEFDITKAQNLAGEIRAEYLALASERKEFPHPALSMHYYKQILPGLALYRVLIRELGDKHKALELTTKLFKINTGPQKFRYIEALRYSPMPLTFLKFGAVLKMNKHFPTAGWKKEFLKGQKGQFAFNIHSCFYLETLNKLGAPELTSLFCQIDDWMMENLPETIIWERKGTLARGAKFCDFRWKRI